MIRDYVETLPDVNVVADLITTRVVLAVAFFSAFVNTGIPQLLSALAVVSLIVFFAFEYRRVLARKVLVRRLSVHSPPDLSTVQGQNRAIVRAILKLNQCIVVTTREGNVVAAAGPSEDILGRRSENLLGGKLQIPDGRRVEEAMMLMDATEYRIVRVYR